MSITIEPMKFVHVDAVAEIENAVYPTPWSKNAFINEVLDNGFAHYFVALNDKSVVGYAGIWVILDEAHITTLAVCQQEQCKGVGTLLLETLIEAAASMGAQRMTLEVRLSNTIAQELYKKYGFIQRGTRRNYYSDEDALIMWLDQLEPARKQTTGGETLSQEDNDA